MAPKLVRRTRIGEEDSAPKGSFIKEEGSEKALQKRSSHSNDGFLARLLARKILDCILEN